MKTVSIILAFITLASCGNKTPRPLTTSFDYIEISFNNGTDGITSVYIDNTKVIKVRAINREKQCAYYQDTLADSVITKLNHFTENAFTNKFDSIVGHPSCFAFPYYLILSNKKQNIQTLVYQDKDYSFRPLDSLTKNIILLTRIIKHNPLDTNFVFKSLQKVVGPLQSLKEMKKFIPPVIKDEQTFTKQNNL